MRVDIYYVCVVCSSITMTTAIILKLKKLVTISLNWNSAFSWEAEYRQYLCSNHFFEPYECSLEEGPWLVLPAHVETVFRE